MRYIWKPFVIALLGLSHTLHCMDMQLSKSSTYEPKSKKRAAPLITPVCLEELEEALKHGDFDRYFQLFDSYWHSVNSAQPCSRANMHQRAYSAKQKTPFHYAAQHGNKEALNSLLSENPLGIKVQDKEGASILHTAAECNQWELFELLIKAGIKVETKNKYGETPLHCASAKGHINAILQLIDRHASVHSRDFSGATPLHLAAMHGHEDVLDFLLNCNNAPVDAEDNNGETALHYAVRNRRIGVMNILMKYHAYVGVHANDGVTPVHVAAQYGFEDALAFLLNRSKAHVKAKDLTGATPLHHAAGFGHTTIIDKLVTFHEDDIEAKTNDGRTPLLLAAQYGQHEALTLLIKLGGNKKAVDHCGLTALHYAARHGHKNIVDDLIKHHGANVEARTYDGRTPLHYAMEYAGESGEIDIINALVLEHHADSDAKDFWGTTAEDIAIFYGNCQAAVALWG